MIILRVWREECLTRRANISTAGHSRRQQVQTFAAKKVSSAILSFPFIAAKKPCMPILPGGQVCWQDLAVLCFIDTEPASNMLFRVVVKVKGTRRKGAAV